mmetsp:Transcript_19076/g.38556  ORF Transcript_19076/g.38556 Transcript_19076/m.38556 type:complete len:244 (+) Transcript_19076:1634-2365(+)
MPSERLRLAKHHSRLHALEPHGQERPVRRAAQHRVPFGDPVPVRVPEDRVRPPRVGPTTESVGGFAHRSAPRSKGSGSPDVCGHLPRREPDAAAHRRAGGEPRRHGAALGAEGRRRRPARILRLRRAGPARGGWVRLEGGPRRGADPRPRMRGSRCVPPARRRALEVGRGVQGDAQGGRDGPARGSGADGLHGHAARGETQEQPRPSRGVQGAARSQAEDSRSTAGELEAPGRDPAGEPDDGG